ncbi:hypothetical protein BS47DRAFT_1490541 [Hydnum rufescens UP504]|uniref:Uncharacterized protein n=1 Tax=Hydnum rufescens UP504 TaxID=1448309 RepID=A0A9P6AD83_9AGAM|nr:hypothetical protein BS47DRAFT_1490541 [Hydnum rufescens UP504]
MSPIDSGGTVSGLSRDCLFAPWEIANRRTPSKSILGSCREKRLPITIKTVPDRAMPHLHPASCTRPDLSPFFSSIGQPFVLLGLFYDIYYISSFPLIGLLCCAPPCSLSAPSPLSLADSMDSPPVLPKHHVPPTSDGLSGREKPATDASSFPSFDNNLTRCLSLLTFSWLPHLFSAHIRSLPRFSTKANAPTPIFIRLIELVHFRLAFTRSGLLVRTLLQIVLSIMSPSFFFHGDEGVLPFQALIFPPSFFAAPHRTPFRFLRYTDVSSFQHSMESNSVSGLSFCEKAQWTWLPVSGYRFLALGASFCCGTFSPQIECHGGVLCNTLNCLSAVLSRSITWLSVILARVESEGPMQAVALFAAIEVPALVHAIEVLIVSCDEVIRVEQKV